MGASRMARNEAGGPEGRPEAQAPSGKAAAFLKRLVSGVIYVAVNVVCILLGSIPTACAMALTAGLACGEFYRLMREDAKLPNQAVGLCFAAAFPLVALVNAVYIIGLVFVFLVVLGIWYVTNQRVRITDLAITIFGALYTGLMLSSVVLIRDAALPGMGATWLTIGVMASVWVNDSFAYLLGSAFGRHPLVPKISPKKSWEGMIGGLAGSVLVWCLMLLLPETGLTLPVTVTAGLLCGVTGVVGDLVESRIKRGAGVKDSGNLMPGHGGMLDRSDSMLFVSVTAYFILRMTGVI